MSNFHEHRNDHKNDHGDKENSSFGQDGFDQDDDMNDDDDSRGGKRGYDLEKDRKMFSRKKSCWFCAKDVKPDWKDPQSYSWLVNEFGKISPSRISGLCAKHQRSSTTAIKRGRNICFLSYISNSTIQ